MNKLFIAMLAISTIATSITFGMNIDPQRLKEMQRYHEQQRIAETTRQQQAAFARMTKPYQPTPTPPPSRK